MTSIVHTSASAEATSIAMPSHQIGDLILIAAYNPTGSVGSVPDGYTGIVTQFSTNGLMFAAKIAESASETYPVMASATLVIAAIVRGDHAQVLDGVTQSTGSGDTITFTGFASSNLVYMGGRSFYAVGTRINNATLNGAHAQLNPVEIIQGATNGSLVLYEHDAVAAGGSLFTVASITPGETLEYWRNVGLLVLDTNVPRGSAGGGNIIVIED